MTEDIFARSLHGELRELAHTAHPSFAQLLRYAQHERTERLSAHVVTCAHCQQELSAIRAELTALERALPRLVPQPIAAPSLVERLKVLRQRWSQQLLPRPVFYGHVVAYAMAAIVLVALNLTQRQIPAEPGLQGGGAAWWAQWPLLVWAALLLWHGYRIWRR